MAHRPCPSKVGQLAILKDEVTRFENACRQHLVPTPAAQPRRVGGCFPVSRSARGQAGDWRRAGGRLGRSGGLRIGFSAIEHAVSGLAVPRWWRCPTPKLSSCQSTSRTGAREWCRGTPSVFLSCPIPFSMSASRRVQMCLSLQKMVVARHCTGGHGVRDGRCRGVQHIAAEAYGAPLLVNGGPQRKLQIQTAQVRQAKVACG